MFTFALAILIVYPWLCVALLVSLNTSPSKIELNHNVVAKLHVRFRSLWDQSRRSTFALLSSDRHAPIPISVNLPHYRL
jgi:hypothetical protein